MHQHTVTWYWQILADVILPSINHFVNPAGHMMAILEDLFVLKMNFYPHEAVNFLSTSAIGFVMPLKRLLARLQETLTAFMEDVISHMAGYVPLKAIAERILAAYANDPFGDFKVLLLPYFTVQREISKVPDEHSAKLMIPSAMIAEFKAAFVAQLPDIPLTSNKIQDMPKFAAPFKAGAFHLLQTTHFYRACCRYKHKHEYSACV